MIVSFAITVQEIATMKFFEENYVDFMTKLSIGNILRLKKHVYQSKIS